MRQQPGSGTPLTLRQRAVFGLVSNGVERGFVARQFGIGKSGVDRIMYRSRIKLGMSTQRPFRGAWLTW